MQTRALSRLALILATIWLVEKAAGADLQFKHHFIDRTLPVTDKLVGDYGLTALVDLDGDGDLDFVLGGRPFNPSQLYWFEYKGADNWVRHLVGTNYLSDVGLAALDVDRDGWLDLVCSGVWYRNAAKPHEQAFERIVFDGNAAGAHDVLIADINGDGQRAGRIAPLRTREPPLASLGESWWWPSLPSALSSTRNWADTNSRLVTWTAMGT